MRIAPASGGEGRVVTKEPGLYREPAFSPDGSKVVYRKDSGGDLLTPDWSTETGLYWSPAAGGAGDAATLVSRDGFGPQFGAASDRVYFTKLEETEGSREQREEEKRVFVSAALDGADLRELYVSENATEFAISPDEKWLAFRERYNAWVTPFVRTGKRIEIGPKAKSLPVVAGLEGRGRVPPLVGGLAAAPLGSRTRALHPRAPGDVRLRPRRAGEAPGSSGEGAADRIRRDDRRSDRFARVRRGPRRHDAVGGR